MPILPLYTPIESALLTLDPGDFIELPWAQRGEVFAAVRSFNARNAARHCFHTFTQDDRLMLVYGIPRVIGVSRCHRYPIRERLGLHTSPWAADLETKLLTIRKNPPSPDDPASPVPPTTPNN